MSQGLRPIDDFFQHHQPILWDLLSLYYRIGLDGAGVLFWGRVLVAVCGLACVWALAGIARNPVSKDMPFAPLGGGGIFILMTLFLPELYVSRPETISITCMLYALLLWCRENSPPAHSLIIAGALAGVACYASPRFLAFGGFFLLLGNHSIRRWALFIGGGLSFLVAYTAVSGFQLEKVAFNIEFSSYLQTVGDRSAGRPADFWNLLAVAMISAMLPLLFRLNKSERRCGLLLVANLLVVYVVCHRTAGLFRYTQAYAPFLFGVPVVAGWLFARWNPKSPRSLAFGVYALVLLFVASVVAAVNIRRPQFQLLEFVRQKDLLASVIPAGGTVMLFTVKHPITARDASYYGSPLFDAQDRLCRAVRGFKNGDILRKRCNFLDDVRDARPYLVDTWTDVAVAEDQLPLLNKLLAEHYEPIRLENAAPLLREGVMVERSTALNQE